MRRACQRYIRPAAAGRPVFAAQAVRRCRRAMGNGRVGWLRCRACRGRTSITARTDIEGHAQAAGTLVPGDLVSLTSQKNGMSALGLRRALGLGSYETSWTWLHKLRAGHGAAGRDHLARAIAGRRDPMWAARKKAERGREDREQGHRRGGRAEPARPRPRAHPPSAPASRTSPPRSLLAFLHEAVGPGARNFAPTGWRGYAGLPAAGYRHQVTVVGGGSGSRRARGQCHASTESPPCSNGGCCGDSPGRQPWALPGLVSGSDGAPPCLAAGPIASSIGVDHRPRASCPTASSGTAVADGTGPPTAPIITPRISADLPEFGGMKGIPTFRQIYWSGELHRAPFCCRGKSIEIDIETLVRLGPIGCAAQSGILYSLTKNSNLFRGQSRKPLAWLFSWQCTALQLSEFFHTNHSIQETRGFGGRLLVFTQMSHPSLFG